MGREGAVRLGWTLAAVIGLVAAGCSGPAGPSGPPPVDEAIPLEGGSLLVFRDGGQLGELREPIEIEVRRALAESAPLLQLGSVRFDVRAGRQYAIPELGFGGRADAGTVRLSFDTSFPDFAATIPTELFPLVAHELHHVARIRAVGFSSNLLEAMVLEGLADQFSVEVAGVDPPLWSSALSEQEILHWFDRAEPIWLRAGYDHDAWFLGTGPEIPRWTGYTLGFELTGRYLARHPGRRASDLVAEPAVRFASAVP